VEAEGDERLAGAGRRPEDDVLARHHLEERLLLRGVEGEAGLGHPVGKGEDLVRSSVPPGGAVLRATSASSTGALIEMDCSTTAGRACSRPRNAAQWPRVTHTARARKMTVGHTLPRRAMGSTEVR
jgi:hypothetical protein